MPPLQVQLPGEPLEAGEEQRIQDQATELAGDTTRRVETFQPAGASQWTSFQPGRHDFPGTVPQTTTNITTTVTTTRTRTTAAAVTMPAGILRRRTSSEGPGSAQVRASDGPAEATTHRLVSLRSIVASRSGFVSSALSTLLTRVTSASGPSMEWADREVVNLEGLEELEAQVWELSAVVDGPSARRSRMECWQEWQSRQMVRVRRIKETSWSLQQARSIPAGRTEGGCNRSSGHVEKVGLPLFSGRHEEFAEFRRQFQELCRGEHYTPVLEMAQLRLKLPKEAVHAIGGLLQPEDAWRKCTATRNCPSCRR